jgi:hypothetical protein
VYSHWKYINIENVVIIDHHLPGKLMYTFGIQKLNLFSISNPSNNIKNNDFVFFCFGEIDCRNHVHKHITETKTYKDIIDELLFNYFEAIKENEKLNNTLKIGVYNIMPTTDKTNVGPNHAYPYKGTEEERIKYTVYANEKIKELCIKNDYIFFDIYNEICDKKGLLKLECQDKSGCHLINPEAATNFIKKNLLNIN